MSAKGAIQNLQDSELIRIFLEFVQTYHLQYQKIDKEISYKCHQATWILATTKATGYGRTESEAYKHALRNLLQILIEDPPYTQFFVSMLTPALDRTNNTNPINPLQPRINQNLNSKQKPVFSSSVSKPPLYSHLSSSLSSNPSSTLANQRDLKTEEKDGQDQCAEKEANRLNTSANLKYQTVNKGSSINTYAGSYKCLIPEQGYGEYRKQYNKTQLNTTQVGESEAEKVCLEKSTSNIKGSYGGYNQDLKQALVRNKSLMQELANIHRQNQMLRAQVQCAGNAKGTVLSESTNGILQTGSNGGENSLSSNSNVNMNITNKGMRLSVGLNHNSSSYLQPSHTKAYSHANINMVPNNLNANNINGSNNPNYNNNSAYTTTTNNNNNNNSNNSNMRDTSNAMRDISNNSYKQLKGADESQEGSKACRMSNNKSKVMVPKLKLEILPNYHKKAEKSLNDSLLAVYEQKHGVTANSGSGESIPFVNVSVHNLKKII